MLVLTRQRHQEIVIGGSIRVTVLSISEKSVRLGIAAPDSVIIQRLEIYQANQATQTQERNPMP